MTSKIVKETLSSDEVEKIEAQIQCFSKIVEYDVKEYPVEIIAEKYQPSQRDDSETDEFTPPEFVIPDYQRDYTWSDERASKFIESIFIGLPIPYMTFAESLDSDEGELEIIDGSQRVRTLTRYLYNDLQLTNLKKLELLNGTYFKELPLLRQRKFKRSTIRIIVLTEKADEESRRDLFERINTGSDQLNEMERRRGSIGGKVVKFIEKLAALPISNEMLKVSETNKRRREKEEFILRFLVYSERYEKFSKSVREFMDQYIEDKNTAWENATICRREQRKIQKEYIAALSFAKAYFPNGFCRVNKNTVPRIRFEALAVGINLALRENPKTTVDDVSWLDAPTFLRLTTSDGSNSRPRLIKRIEFVRNVLLGRPLCNS